MLENLDIDFWRPLAGLVIFLVAMSFIENAIKTLIGKRIKQAIARNADHTLGGILTGTLATALLQSSSLVGLLVLAFVGARIMRLKQALLIIFGANLGTTATGWVVALVGFKLNLDAISLPMIALFGLCYLTFNHRVARHLGQLGLGIGLLLLAMQFMKSAIGDLNAIVDSNDLASLALWQYALFGIAASTLMQSSSAVMVLTLSAMNSGIIDLSAGAALMIGADLGTTSTIMFGAIGGTPNKKRVALGHVAFNLVTDVIAFCALTPLVALVVLIGDPLFSLVAFHSLFNVLGVVLWAPLTPRFARALESCFVSESTQLNLFLDPSAQGAEEPALTAVAHELDAFAQKIICLNQRIFQTEVEQIPPTDDYRTAYRDCKRLEAEILEYALATQFPGSAHFSKQLDTLLLAARNLLLSSKLCKDNLDDLRELADYQSELFTKLTFTQKTLYESLPPARELFNIELGHLDELFQQSKSGHDALHEFIYRLIQADELPPDKVSTVLNLNRALFNSNTALVTGVALMTQYHQAKRLGVARWGMS